MSTYDLVEGLELELDGYELRRLDSPITSGTVRSTSVIVLAGEGEEGLGEDVTYANEDHDALQAAGLAQGEVERGGLEGPAAVVAIDLGPGGLWKQVE